VTLPSLFPSNLFVVLFCLLQFQFASANSALYQDGDLIFHESQSPQSLAIKEATKSKWSHVGILFANRGKWYVAEAANGVTYTPVGDFIARGKNGVYRIYRLPGLTEAQRQELQKQVNKVVGRNYDIYFEWSDDLIYCSELVYKTYLAATGIEIGRVQKFRDFNLNGPYLKELIRRRIVETGRTLNLEEAIVTPAAQIFDPKLELIERFQ
jgi:hypothetical protein